MSVKLRLKKIFTDPRLPAKVYNAWVKVYEGFAKKRFVKFSRGSGNWPKLKRKRKRGAKAKAAILRDTGTLFNALEFTAKTPGSLKQILDDGVRVGFGGVAQHPKAPMTISKLAAIHHFGQGHMPERKIIVQPDSITRLRMEEIVEKYWNDISR